MSHNEYRDQMTYDKYDLDLKILGYSTNSNINTINIHKDIKDWGVVSGNYFRGDPEGHKGLEKKTLHLMLQVMKYLADDVPTV